MSAEPIPGFDAVRLRADNPGPMTLDGTNTYVLGRDPCWIVDPGPDLPEHLDAIAAEATTRGGAGGIAITHGHADHTDGVAGLLDRLGASATGGGAAGGTDVPVGALGWTGRTETLADGGSFGPLGVMALPGHAADHVVFLWGGLCCAGDTVLGAGSVFVPGDLAGYLAGLERLRALAPDVICPGHGPLVTDPAAKVTEYIEHRLDRERGLAAGLEAGARTDDELLDAAWSDVPAPLRPAAQVTMHAHLRKLAAEGRLPDGLEPPAEGDLPAV